MLINFDTATQLINDGKLLHIAGTETMLRKLPRGKWIGGSTEYFMGENGAMVSDDQLHVIEYPYNFRIKTYDTSNLSNVAADGFEKGFSIVILPFNSVVHREYAENAPRYQDMFAKKVAGWISGINFEKKGQIPITVNGMTGDVLTDKAVAMHLGVGEGKKCIINIINIFSQDESSPVIRFIDEGFKVGKCLVDGEEMNFSDYLVQNAVNTTLPLVGDYSGVGVNISFAKIENNFVHLAAPVFKHIKYRIAKNIPDYAKTFNEHLAGMDDSNIVFSCNCVLNFMHGGLEGKTIGALDGPITFGEIAFQLVNQTLVYVKVRNV